MMKQVLAVFLLVALLLGGAARSQRVDIGPGSVAETVSKLRPGEFVWAPAVAPDGPTLLIVNVTSQRAVLYRNGVPIAASTVSTGKPGYSTPTGVFTILQKHVEHYSSTYDNAPMPYMQRLTWRGIALHAGKLPGYPASHGCVRLPLEFARLLYKVTTLGMTVVITKQPANPRIAPSPDFAREKPADVVAAAVVTQWSPERSPSGPVSIVVSAADRRAIILRNGVMIGMGPVIVEGPVTGTWAYSLRNVDADGQHWTRVPLSSEAESDQAVPSEEWQRFRAPENFRRAVAGIVAPGTTIVVTADSLNVSSGNAVTVLDAEQSRLDGKK